MQSSAHARDIAALRLLSVLAVTTPDRSKLLPEVPTIAESAVPGFSAAIRYGLAAPAGTSAAIVERLSRELRSAVMSEEVRERMLNALSRLLARQRNMPQRLTPRSENGRRWSRA